MFTILITAEEVVELLRLAAAEVGSQKALARQHGISEQYVNDVLRGRREPGQKILDIFGLEKVVYYRRRQ